MKGFSIITYKKVDLCHLQFLNLVLAHMVTTSLFKAAGPHDWLHLGLIQLLLFPDVLETIANLSCAGELRPTQRPRLALGQDRPRDAARKQGRTADWLCSFFGKKASKLCKSIITPEEIGVLKLHPLCGSDTLATLAIIPSNS